MDDWEERTPQLRHEEVAVQIENCHRQCRERTQEFVQRAESLQDVTAQFENTPPRRESSCCKRCCTIL
ncbi:hypothetical protein MAR_009327 [Mya arenaria]|uniref:Uncharacterized protein n=1 Tax=Mya arenaria TaxID=6604 RepID=A0ABY7E0I5_MYAAR|nr:hypothetical protein MAR_009327 [Mya arenaria]